MTYVEAACNELDVTPALLGYLLSYKNEAMNRANQRPSIAALSLRASHES